ncbi:MAG: (d)CMP kinase [Caldisericaceae bacterium]|nr:(d)CMP kinase [Caldisericaceae bacterium]
MRKNKDVAIDGDAGSGKSTVGRLLADRIQFEFIDSGLLYRAFAYIVLKKCAGKSNREEWVNIIQNIEFDLKGRVIYIDGKDVNEIELRKKEVDDLVSPVSTVKEIREIATEKLRKIADSKSVVMVGRDIGSVVLKNAFLKIYLTAPIKVRAKRRQKELFEKGADIAFEEVLDNLKNRDVMDSNRNISPLTIPQDAYVIDTNYLSPGQVVDKIIQFLKGREYAV